MATSGRVPDYILHAAITDESHDGWSGFASTHAVDKSALCEVIGLRLRDFLDVPEEELPETLRAIITAARRVQVERKRRRRG